MWDERSFSTTSFDARSWFFGIVATVVRRIKQFFVRTEQVDTYASTQVEDVWIKKSKS